MDFQKLLKALGCNANRILGIAVLPPEDGRRLEEMFCRVRNLKQGEQDVVVQTMKTLMDWRRNGREFLRIRWGFCRNPHYPLRQAEDQAAKLVTWNGGTCYNIGKLART